MSGVALSIPQYAGRSNQYISSGSGEQLTSATVYDGQGRFYEVQVTPEMMQNGTLSLDFSSFNCTSCLITYNFTSRENSSDPSSSCGWNNWAYEAQAFGGVTTTATEGTEIVAGRAADGFVCAGLG